MELFIFFAIAALGGFWWVNHVMKKKTDALFQPELKKDETQVPYKVEPLEVPVATAEPIVTKEVAVEPPTEVVTTEVAPVVEKPKKPRKSAAKKPTEKKPAAKKPVTTAKKIKK
jgi:hypothetical protein